MRGGDIDLLIEAVQVDDEIVRAEVSFLSGVQSILGKQKNSCVAGLPFAQNSPPTFSVAGQTGILL
ncbi:hypothetical protein [Candidatus Methylospira mobilis]|nr:hypothetical protein [Candidatus Methylospira mobilis]